MAEYSQTPDDLFPFAEALVRVLIWRYRVPWNEHRLEDARQELFLAGWQVWRDKGDIGLAKNRMASRMKNLLRDFISEKKHEPKVEPDLVEIEESLDRRSQRDDPVEQAIVNEYLDRLPERHRRMVLLKMAGHTDSEIAAELGVSLRTIEREFSQLRKERKKYDERNR